MYRLLGIEWNRALRQNVVLCLQIISLHFASERTEVTAHFRIFSHTVCNHVSYVV
jgi:hypothetical protein